MTNTVPVLIEELEGSALDIVAERFVGPCGLAIHTNEELRAIVAAHTEGPTVQVPASLVGGE